MRSKIFLKLTLAALVLIVVATVTIDFAIRHAWEESLRRNLIEGSLAALVLSMLLAALAAHSIARRLQRITGFAERIARGELSARIADPSSDEITQVATALDKTANRLQENFTELENSRKHLETLLNSMQEAVVAVSAEQKIRWLNGSMARLLPRGTHVGKALLHVIRDPELLRALDESMRNGRVVNTRVATVAPGQIFQATTAPLPEGGAVAVLHDLTEIERVEKTRRDFIANVSHELRTPLTSIQGYAETLLDSSSSANGSSREFLEVIRKNAARMSRLTEDLLTLARVESGERKLELRPVAAGSLLEDALRNFRELARSQGVELLLEQSVPLEVLADADAIHQVFSNLIDNAIKYAGAGRRVMLGAHAQANAVEFYVRDFGPGIAAEHHRRIFERFYRVDKARSRESGGTGLGLAIVKHIVLNHGGSVRVDSTLHHGATFLFSLPAVPSAVYPS